MELSQDWCDVLSSARLCEQVRREEGRGSFPGPRDVWGARQCLKILEKGVPDDVFLTSNMHKIHFRPGLRPAPDPTGSLLCSLTHSRMVRGHPSPRFLPRSRHIRNDVVIGPSDNGFPGPAAVALDGPVHDH